MSLEHTPLCVRTISLLYRPDLSNLQYDNANFGKTKEGKK